MEDSVQKLYNAMAEHYNLDMGYDAFKEGLSDDANRQQVYDAISRYYNAGTFEDFSKRLLGSAPVEPVRAEEVTAPATIQQNAPTPGKLYNNTPYFQASRDNYVELPANQLAEEEAQREAVKANGGAATMKDVSPAVQNLGEGINAIIDNFSQNATVVKSPEEQRERVDNLLVNNYRAQHAGLMPSITELDDMRKDFREYAEDQYRDRVDAGDYALEQITPEEEAAHKRVTQANGTDIALAAEDYKLDKEYERKRKANKNRQKELVRSKEYQDSRNRSIERQREGLAEMMAAYDEFNAQHRSINPDRTDEIAPMYVFDTDDARNESRLMSEAIQLKKKSLKAEKAPVKAGGEGFKMTKGVWDSVNDPDFWTFGFSEVMRNVDFRNTMKRFAGLVEEYGEDAENHLTEGEKALISAFFENVEVQARRQAGLSPVYTAGRMAAESIPFMVQFALTDGVGAAVKEGVQKGVLDLIAKGSAKLADKVGSRFVAESLGGLAKTALRTVVMPSTLNEMSNRYAEMDEAGNFKYTPGQSIWLGGLSSGIENLSESFGAGLERLGIGERQIAKLFSKTPASEWAKKLFSSGEFLAKGGWNGYFGEALEEWYGTALRSLLMPQDGSFAEQWSDFLSKDNMLSMHLGFAPMALVGLPGSARRRSALRGELAKVSEYSDMQQKVIDAQIGLLEGDFRNAMVNAGVNEKEVDDFLNERDNMSMADQTARTKELLNKAMGWRYDSEPDFEESDSLGTAAATLMGRIQYLDACKQTAQSQYEAVKKEYEDAISGKSDTIWNEKPEKVYSEETEQRVETAPEQPAATQQPVAETPAPTPVEATAPEQPATAPAPKYDNPDKQRFFDTFGDVVTRISNDGRGSLNDVVPITKEGSPAGFLVALTPGMNGSMQYVIYNVDAGSNKLVKEVLTEEQWKEGKYWASPTGTPENRFYSDFWKTVDGAKQAAKTAGAQSTEGIVNENTEDVNAAVNAGKAEIVANATPEEKNELAKEMSEEEFDASLPRDKKGELVFDEFTPSQEFRYTAREFGLERAVSRARKYIEASEDAIAKIDPDSAPLKELARAKALQTRIDEYRNILAQYEQDVPQTEVPAAPAAGASAAAPAPAPAPAQAPAAESYYGLEIVNTPMDVDNTLPLGSINEDSEHRYRIADALIEDVAEANGISSTEEVDRLGQEIRNAIYNAKTGEDIINVISSYLGNDDAVAGFLRNDCGYRAVFTETPSPAPAPAPAPVTAEPAKPVEKKQRSEKKKSAVASLGEKGGAKEAKETAAKKKEASQPFDVQGVLDDFSNGRSREARRKLRAHANTMDAETAKAEYAKAVIARDAAEYGSVERIMNNHYATALANRLRDLEEGVPEVKVAEDSKPKTRAAEPVSEEPAAEEPVDITKIALGKELDDVVEAEFASKDAARIRDAKSAITAITGMADEATSRTEYARLKAMRKRAKEGTPKRDMIDYRMRVLGAHLMDMGIRPDTIKAGTTNAAPAAQAEASAEEAVAPAAPAVEEAPKPKEEPKPRAEAKPKAESKPKKEPVSTAAPVSETSSAAAPAQAPARPKGVTESAMAESRVRDALERVAVFNAKLNDSEHNGTILSDDEYAEAMRLYYEMKDLDTEIADNKKIPYTMAITLGDELTAGLQRIGVPTKEYRDATGRRRNSDILRAYPEFAERLNASEAAKAATAEADAARDAANAARADAAAEKRKAKKEKADSNAELRAEKDKFDKAIEPVLEKLRDISRTGIYQKENTEYRNQIKYLEKWGKLPNGEKLSESDAQKEKERLQGLIDENLRDMQEIQSEIDASLPDIEQAFADYVEAIGTPEVGRVKQARSVGVDVDKYLPKANVKEQRTTEGAPKATAKETRRLVNQLKKILADSGIDVTVLSGAEYRKKLAEVMKNSPVYQQMAFHGTHALLEKEGGNVVRGIPMGFDHRFMSTGEGGQYYGYGSYVTTNPDTAKHYMANMVASHPTFEEENWNDILERLQEKYDNYLQEENGNEEAAKRRFLFEDKDVEKLEDGFESSLFYIDDNGRVQPLYRTEEEFDNNTYNDSWRDFLDNVEQVFPGSVGERVGHLVEVQIPDDDGYNYLHWNEPITEEQAEAIRNAIRERVGNGWGEGFEDELKSAISYGTYGRHIEGALDYFLGDEKNYSTGENPGAKRNSELLNSVGIIGMEVPIGNRGGQTFEGSNYVIYNDNTPVITKDSGYAVDFSKEDEDGMPELIPLWEQRQGAESSGFVDGEGHVYINSDAARVDTPLHEIGLHAVMRIAEANGYQPLIDAIQRYGAEAPEEFKQRVRELYPELKEGSKEFNEEVAAHAFGEHYADRQKDFADKSAWQRLIDAIKQFFRDLKDVRVGNKKLGDIIGAKADLSVFDAVNTMGYNDIGDSLYNLVMGGKTIAAPNGYSNAANEQKTPAEKATQDFDITFDITQNANGRTGQRNKELIDQYNGLLNILRTSKSQSERDEAAFQLKDFMKNRQREMEEMVKSALDGTGLTFEVRQTHGVYESDGEYSFEVVIHGRGLTSTADGAEKMRKLAQGLKQDAYIEGYSVDGEEADDDILAGEDGVGTVPSLTLQFDHKLTPEEIAKYTEDYRGDCKVSDDKIVYLYFGETKSGYVELKNKLQEFKDKYDKEHGNGNRFNQRDDGTAVQGNDAERASGLVLEPGFYRSIYHSANAIRDNEGNVVAWTDENGEPLADQSERVYSEDRDLLIRRGRKGVQGAEEKDSGGAEETPAVREQRVAGSIAQQAYNQVEAVAKNASGPMTPADWKKEFKKAGITDPVLDKMLSGMNPLRTISADEIINWADKRYADENPVAADERGSVRSVDTAIRYLKDNTHDYNVLRRQVERAGGVIPAGDFAETYTNRLERSQSVLDKFEKDYQKPLNDAAATIIRWANANGLTITEDEVGYYLLALNAPARNKWITVDKAKEKAEGEKGMPSDDVIADMYDNICLGKATAATYAGGTEAEKSIAQYLEGMKDPQDRNWSGSDGTISFDDKSARERVEAFESTVPTWMLINLLDKMRAASQYILNKSVEYGFHDRAFVDQCNERYPNYAPFVDWENEKDKEDALSSFENAGFRGDFKPFKSTMSPNIRKASRGRKSLPANPLAMILYKAANTIFSGEENKSRQMLYELVNENRGMSNLFYAQYVTPDGKLVDAGEKPDWFDSMSDEEKRKHGVQTFINGTPVIVYFNGDLGAGLHKGLEEPFNILTLARNNQDKWPTAASIAKGLHNANTRLAGALSQVMTTFNPAFPPVNAIRDVRYAARQMAIMEGSKSAGKFISSIIPALWESALNWSGKPSKMFQEFIEDGGYIGYSRLGSPEMYAKDIAKTIERISAGKNEKASMKAFADFMHGYANMFENVARFAAYKVARENGADRAHAAHLAHEVSTNLSRRGTQKALSAWTLFFNANLEGAAQQVRNLRDKKTRARAIGTILADFGLSLLSGIAMRALAAGGGDGDDDKKNLWEKITDRDNPYNWIADYVKRGQRVIPFGVNDKGEIKGAVIQQPFMYRANDMISEYLLQWISGKIDGGEFVKKSLESLSEEYNPFAGTSLKEANGSGRGSWNFLPIPTAARPLVDVARNTSSLGYPIYNEYRPDQAGATRRDYLNAKPGTNPLLVGASRNHLLPVKPETIEYLLSSTLGTYWDLFDYGTSKLFGQPSEERRYGQKKAPIVGRFYTTGGGAMYDRLEELRQLAETERSYKARINDAIGEGDKLFDSEYMKDVAMGKTQGAAGIYDQYRKGISELEKAYRTARLVSKNKKMGDTARKLADDAALRIYEDGIRKLNYETWRLWEENRERIIEGLKTAK